MQVVRTRIDLPVPGRVAYIGPFRNGESGPSTQIRPISRRPPSPHVVHVVVYRILPRATQGSSGDPRRGWLQGWTQYAQSINGRLFDSVFPDVRGKSNPMTLACCICQRLIDASEDVKKRVFSYISRCLNFWHPSIQRLSRLPNRRMAEGQKSIHEKHTACRETASQGSSCSSRSHPHQSHSASGRSKTKLEPASQSSQGRPRETKKKQKSPGPPPQETPPP